MIQLCVDSLAQTYIIHMHMYSLLLILHPLRHQPTCSLMYDFILLSFIYPSTHPFMKSAMVFFSLSSTHLPTIHVFSPKFVGMSSSLSYPSTLTANLPIHRAVHSHVFECFFSQPFNHPLSTHPCTYLCMHVSRIFSFSSLPLHSSVHLSTHTTINLLIYV